MLVVFLVYKLALGFGEAFLIVTAGWKLSFVNVLTVH